MQLTKFIQDLLEKGQVTVAGQLMSFSEQDIGQSVTILKGFYAEDRLEMPLEAPEFSPEAALWAVQYLYHAIQFVMLRDLGEEQVTKHLTAYSGNITPEAVYSADLMLRYLPDLLHLAKGLAPDDVLVTSLKNTLEQWPFSSVGLEGIAQVNCDVILTHASLKYAYMDRIIQQKDITRAAQAKVSELIEEALGGHAQNLWPEFENKKHN